VLFVVPVPSNPLVPFPQHFTPPVSRRTQCESFVLASAVAPEVSPGTWVGTTIAPAAPEILSLPQHFTAPTLVLTHVENLLTVRDAEAMAFGLFALVSLASADTDVDGN
jgi:hypothetical protein